MTTPDMPLDGLSYSGIVNADDKPTEIPPFPNWDDVTDPGWGDVDDKDRYITIHVQGFRDDSARADRFLPLMGEPLPAGAVVFVHSVETAAQAAYNGMYNHLYVYDRATGRLHQFTVEEEEEGHDEL